MSHGDLGVVHGDRVSRRLVFHFKDGSIQDESVACTQRGTFRLSLERSPDTEGPGVPASDGCHDRWSQRAGKKVRYTDDDGKEKALNERLALPADVANGLLPTLLKNVLGACRR